METMQFVWGWQPALYLFLGGMGAGAFVTAGILYFQDKAANARTICAASWAAVACLVVGLLLLVSELTAPLRGMLMWQSFVNFGSWMTIGAWVLFASVVVFGLMALLSTERVLKALGKDDAKGRAAIDKVRTPLAAIGIVLGLGVAAYTGVLLMAAPGVPLWNTFVLPCLFTVSALDTGVALVEILAATAGRGAAPASRRFMQRAVVTLVVLELVALAVFLFVMPGADGATAEGSWARNSAAVLVSGDLAAPFWVLVVLCGLALPLFAAASALARKGAGEGAPAAKGAPDRVVAAGAAGDAAAAPKKGGHGLAVLGAAGAIVGGCALRFLVLAVGTHVDVVASTVFSLIS